MPTELDEQAREMQTNADTDPLREAARALVAASLPVQDLPGLSTFSRVPTPLVEALRAALGQGER